ncbi:MAG: alpha-hydroxy-acid oxidizing protein [Lachnospiraceae bacterium]|nr:alpha-hydroxy-acid oxidizing protein [Lachnospiraceae bacterium]
MMEKRGVQITNPASSKEITRAYFDSLLVEERLMDSCVPVTDFELYEKRFKTPIMTAALSHIGTFNPDMPSGMVQYAQGAAMAGAVHWIGMGSDEEFESVVAAGAPTIRIIKPYADEEKIYQQIRCAEKNGALAVGMDIDHMLDLKGEPDVCMGELMAVKSSEDLKRYVECTKLPFIIKGVLSVHDALKCAEIGVRGIVVSHHGGRLNYAVPPLYVLPDIVKAVGDKMPIFVDCGICSGMDAYKALALGATAVSVGLHLIPMIRQGGAEGVAKRIQEMTEEMKGVMAYTGVASPKHFDASVIHRL